MNARTPFTIEACTPAEYEQQGGPELLRITAHTTRTPERTFYAGPSRVLRMIAAHGLAEHVAAEIVADVLAHETSGVASYRIGAA